MNPYIEATLHSGTVAFVKMARNRGAKFERMYLGVLRHIVLSVN